MGEVLDLDVLRPKPSKIKLAGKEIDVSYMPCGITFEVDKIVRALAEVVATGKATDNGEETHRAFDLSIDLCVVFCSWKHPELDREWFMDNTDPRQVEALASKIQETLQRSYAGAEAYQKN